MFSTAEEVPVRLHDGLVLDFATAGMLLKHRSTSWVDNSCKFLQKKGWICIAKSVLVLCCCFVYAREGFSLTGAWKSAASFYPVFLDFCITLIFW